MSHHYHRNLIVTLHTLPNFMHVRAVMASKSGNLPVAPAADSDDDEEDVVMME